MNTGQIISGAGHIGLIGWALLGGMFTAEPLPFEVTEVTAISAEDYAALIAQQQAVQAVANIDTPAPPEPGEAPQLSSQADAAVELSQPDAAQTPPLEEAPETPDIAPPQPAELTDEPPVLEQPSEDVAVLIPEIAPRPQPRPAPRIAPEPVARPEPDVQVDEQVQPETTPDAAAETPREETGATAPEEATTEIVTEAEKAASAAPPRSLRPRSRPARPVAQQTETAEAPQTDNSAVNNALAEALGDTGNDTPSGPPLTRGEKDALRVAVQQCWNVGSLSSDALRTTVVVSVSMNEDGTPKNNSIRIQSSSGGSGSAAKQAYEAARRAIIRCGARGYDLPKAKYDNWRDIEITFNPEKMRIK